MSLNSFSNSKDSMEVARVLTKDLLYVSGQKKLHGIWYFLFSYTKLECNTLLIIVLIQMPSSHSVKTLLYFCIFVSSLLYFCLLCNTVRPVSPYLAVT